MALPNLPLYAGVFNGYNTVPAAASLLLRVETNTQFGSPQPSGEIASAINLMSYDTLQAAAAGWSQRNQSVTYRILDVNGNVLDTSGYLDVFTQDPSFPDGTWNRNPGTYFIEVTNPNPSAPLVVEVANHGSVGDSSVLFTHTAQVLSSPTAVVPLTIQQAIATNSWLASKNLAIQENGAIGFDNAAPLNLTANTLSVFTLSLEADTAVVFKQSRAGNLSVFAYSASEGLVSLEGFSATIQQDNLVSSSLLPADDYYIFAADLGSDQSAVTGTETLTISATTITTVPTGTSGQSFPVDFTTGEKVKVFKFASGQVESGISLTSTDSANLFISWLPPTIPQASVQYAFVYDSYNTVASTTMVASNGALTLANMPVLVAAHMRDAVIESTVEYATNDSVKNLDLLNGKAVVFKLHPQASESITITSSGVGYDTMFAVYNDESIKIAFNDDYNDDYNSQVTFDVITGRTYTFVVAAPWGDIAGGDIVITGNTSPFATSAPTPAPSRSNIKFSQRSIKGLPEALAALSLAVSTQGTNSSQALTDAIASEVAARNGAITNAIATEVANRDAAINAAVQGVLGSAPEALDTLKEIADYIAVNPSANVADAINAAIAAANQAVANLTDALNAEKEFSDWKEKRADRIREEDIVLSEIGADGFAAATTTYPALTVLNYGDARYIDLLTGVYYDLAVIKTSNFSVHKIDFNGLQDEVGAVAGKTVRIQYVTTHESMGFDSRAQYNS
jgi:hypothetical protein